MEKEERVKLRRIATAMEVLIVFASILLYIWRWEEKVPHSWLAILAVILASHFVHRDSAKQLGLTFFELRAGAQIILPAALAIFLPIVIWALARHRLLLLIPSGSLLLSRFLSYLLWCAVQQYLAQGYFHHRLMSVVRNTHFRCLLVAVMFGAAHLPNPILMVITTVGGFVLAEVYARHPNIWPLALVQAVAGFLVAALVPPALIHNMRVGPGYYRFQG